MISETRLRTLARQSGISTGLAEKNYVNSWILHGIYTSALADALVFKGGTALSKLYFPEIWRFSEDLDFTATAQLRDINTQLKEALSGIETESGISFELTNYHEAGDPVGYIQIDVQYDAVLGQRSTSRIDITPDEPLAFTTEDHLHGPEDIPEFTLTAYSVEEIFVEKLRSLYQKPKARHFYDIYRLLQRETFNDHRILKGLQEKSEARGIDPALSKGLPAEDIESVLSYWDNSLDRLVQEKPEFEKVVQRIDRYLKRLARLNT